MANGDQLRAELEVVELEEALAKAKKERPRCKTCGRLELNKSADDKKFTALKEKLREARRVARLARDGA